MRQESGSQLLTSMASSKQQLQSFVQMIKQAHEKNRQVSLSTTQTLAKTLNTGNSVAATGAAVDGEKNDTKRTKVSARLPEGLLGSNSESQEQMRSPSSNEERQKPLPEKSPSARVSVTINNSE